MLAYKGTALIHSCIKACLFHLHPAKVLKSSDIALENELVIFHTFSFQCIIFTSLV